MNHLISATAPGAGTRRVGRPTRRGRQIVLVATLALRCAIDAGAQPTSTSAPSPPPPVTAQLRVTRAYHENFLQAPEGRPQQDVWATRAELRLEERAGSARRVKGQARVDLVHFEPYGFSPAVAATLGRDTRRYAIEGGSYFQWNRPRVDQSDVPERTDAFGVTGRASVRPIRALDVFGTGGYRREFAVTLVAQLPWSPWEPADTETRSEVRSDYTEYGGGVRVPGLGSAFLPEVGYVRLERRGTRPHEDYLEDVAYVSVRSSIGRRFTFSGRYRYRERAYTTGDARARNRGRTDTRHAAGGSIDLGLTRHLYVTVSGGVEEGTSTQPGRAFESRVLESGLSVRF